MLTRELITLVFDQTLTLRNTAVGIIAATEDEAEREVLREVIAAADQLI